MTAPRQMIEDIRDAAAVGSRNGGIDINDWEEGFVSDLEDRLNDDWSLTGPQLETLTGIWDRI